MARAAIVVVPDAEVAQALWTAFDRSSEPLALPKLAGQVPKAFLSSKVYKDRHSSILEGLQAEGRLFRFPPFKSGRNPRFWTRDQQTYASELIRIRLNEKPHSPTDLVKGVKSRLKDWPAERWNDSIAALLSAGRIRQLPPVGASKVRRLSLRPPQPREYLAPAFKKAIDNLAKVTAKLRGEGVEGADLLKEVSALWNEALPRIVDGRAGSASPLVRMPPSEEIHDAANVRRAPSSDDLIKGMLAVKPDAGQGAMVALPDLRRALGERFLNREEFDKAVFRLAEEGRVDLHRHAFPASLDEAQKAALVTDGLGQYFIGIVLRG